MQQLARQRDMYKVLAQKGGVMVVTSLVVYLSKFFLLLCRRRNNETICKFYKLQIDQIDKITLNLLYYNFKE